MLCKLNFPKNIRCPKMTDGWKFHRPYIPNRVYSVFLFPLTTADYRFSPTRVWTGVVVAADINLKYRWNFAGKICRGFFLLLFRVYRNGSGRKQINWPVRAEIDVSKLTAAVEWASPWKSVRIPNWFQRMPPISILPRRRCA